MKRLALATLFMSLLATQVAAAAPPPAPDPDTTVKAIVDVVKRALQDTKQSMGSLPPFKSVSLTLTTEVKKVLGGDFEFVVVKLGGTRSSKASQAMTIELIPPKSGSVQVSGNDIYEDLKNALLAAARGARDARAAGGDVLALKGFSAEIGFDLERVKNGGLKFKLGPINIGGTGSSTSTTGNKIKVTFEEKDTK